MTLIVWCAWSQVVNTECNTTNFDLQPTFSECLEYVEGDPCEDTRQSKKQKVQLPQTLCLVQLIHKLSWQKLV